MVQAEITETAYIGHMFMRPAGAQFFQIKVMCRALPGGLYSVSVKGCGNFLAAPVNQPVGINVGLGPGSGDIMILAVSFYQFFGEGEEKSCYSSCPGQKVRGEQMIRDTGSCQLVKQGVFCFCIAQKGVR